MFKKKEITIFMVYGKETAITKRLQKAIEIKSKNIV